MGWGGGGGGGGRSGGGGGEGGKANFSSMVSFSLSSVYSSCAEEANFLLRLFTYLVALLSVGGTGLVLRRD